MEAAATTTTKKPVSYAYKYLNSPYAKLQYPRRLKLFFDHLKLSAAAKEGGGAGVVEGDDLVEEQGQAFLDKAKENPRWAQEMIIDFIDFHKKRVLKKRVSCRHSDEFFPANKIIL